MKKHFPSKYKFGKYGAGPLVRNIICGTNIGSSKFEVVKLDDLDSQNLTRMVKWCKKNNKFFSKKRASTEKEVNNAKRAVDLISTFLENFSISCRKQKSGVKILTKSREQLLFYVYWESGNYW